MVLILVLLCDGFVFSSPLVSNVTKSQFGVLMILLIVTISIPVLFKVIAFCKPPQVILKSNPRLNATQGHKTAAEATDTQLEVNQAKL